MKKVDLKHIENVEGKYHLVFLEGRKTMECAKEDLRNAFFSLLLFGALLAGFVLIGGFNFFYIYFLLAFLVVFIAMITVFLLQKRKGKKKCCVSIFPLCFDKCGAGPSGFCSMDLEQPFFMPSFDHFSIFKRD